MHIHLNFVEPIFYTSFLRSFNSWSLKKLLNR